MISTEQIKELHERVELLGKCVDVEGKRTQVAQRQEKAAAPDFWNDAKAAEAFLKETAGLKFWVDGYDKALGAVEDLDVLYEFAQKKMLWKRKKRKNWGRPTQMR